MQFKKEIPIRYYYCNYCERIYSDKEDYHLDICGNFEEVTYEEYKKQEEGNTNE